LYLADDSGHLHVFDISSASDITPAPLAGLRGVEFLALSPGGTRLLTGPRSIITPTATEALQVWDTDSGRLRLLLSEGGPAMAAAFGYADRLLAVADGWGTVHLWDLSQGTNLARFENNVDVQALAISPDGRFLAVAAREAAQTWPGLVRVFDIAPDSLVRQACRRLPPDLAAQTPCPAPGRRIR
jgi:WD40 repeat protein